MQIEYNTGKASIVLVKVPEDASEFELETNQSSIPYGADLKWLDSYFRGLPNYDSYSLPKGNWTLIGSPFTLPEHDCATLIHMGEHIKDLGYFLPVPGYWGFKYYKSARQYLNSILTHLQIYATNPLQDEWDELCTWGHGSHMTLADYKLAGERSGNWVLLVKES